MINRLFSIIISFLLLLGAHTSLASATEVAYAKQGGWQITTVKDRGQFSYCAADTDNSSVSLRIATDGQNWQIGAPFYEQGPVMGDIGFYQLNEVLQFNTDGDGWASAAIPAGFLNSLRVERQFMMQLDRGVQVWSLKGSSAAIGKAMECAANRGAKPKQKANRQPKDLSERNYGTVRGWTVRTGYDDRGTPYCSAEVRRKNGTLRIMSNGSEWLLGVPYTGNGTKNGGIILDGQGDGAEFFSNGSGWAATQVAPEFIEDIAKGRKLTIEHGRASHVVRLKGSAAALLKIKECLQTGGQPPVGQAHMPKPQIQSQTPSLAFSGSWVWNNATTKMQQPGNVSKLEMFENNRFRYCYNSDCRLVTGDYGPDDSMSFSSDGTNYFEFMFPEPGVAEGRYWLSFNGPARAPDATITMYAP
ncbi:hypothetical protein [Pseudovibrio sp. Tun.PSC04-5.I4]|uniref:hypothetical protein n=1 Tax=Pseudovibrio sp. Tun.PSC04-5.I4 TaxID=1798213 RepID=UPI000887A78D|nr:hypothetical protein [Pseudovibrio sp. Tun.PSC04-5.I4]SDQ72761.1 hypothetical protein SAMN04515695_1142 [Pseudovibrio sp. Tun.PSC04-5.I4]